MFDLAEEFRDDATVASLCVGRLCRTASPARLITIR
jgi:hypothetical protein